MEGRVNVWRVLLKTVLLLLVANYAYAWLALPVGRVTIYNSVIPGRVRFPYEKEPSLYSVGYNLPVFEDFDAMFGAHIISDGPKPANEFRVILLGDSSTWGGHVAPEDMLAQQINQLGLSTCDGRTITVYNLGYPWPSVVRDILILDRAMEYQPDMVIWLVTLHSFEPKPEDSEFIAPYADRMVTLLDRYQLDIPNAYFRQPESTFWDQTIFGQRNHLKKNALNQVYGVLWAATSIDNSNGLSKGHPVFSQAVTADVSYFDYSSPEQAPILLRTLMMDVLRAGGQMTDGLPLIVVNEPIFIASGQNHELRYNSMYPRWAYDIYRTSLADWTEKHGIRYFDYWDALPVLEFANDTFHRDPHGEERFANLLAPVIGKNACP